MNTVSEQTAVAYDVPDWLLDYGNKLDWNNHEVAQTARAQVSRYMLSLPQKNYKWRRGSMKDYAGTIPPDVLDKISSVNWNAVPLLVQQSMKALLPAV